MTDFHGTMPADVREAINLRRDIEEKFKLVGIDPMRWLIGFDERCLTIDRKRFAHGEAMKAVTANQKLQIEIALDEQKWDANERQRDYVLYGFSGGLHNATDEQIDLMWRDYKKSRMI